MKKILFSAASMLLVASSAFAADDEQYFFNIAPKDASEVTLSIPFSQKPVLNYALDEAKNNTLIVSAEGMESTTIVLDQQYVITYTYDKTPVAITEAVASSELNLESGIAVVSGLKAGEIVNIYNMGGVRVGKIVADNGGVAVIDMATAPKGIIIIKTSKASFKVQK